MSIIDGKFWTQSWNPIHVKGGGWRCSKISPGCLNCWAETMNIRYGNGRYFGADSSPFKFELNQRILEQPLHWKKPRIVAVQWLGDLFHEQMPWDLIAWMCWIMRKAKQHKFLLLTKRPEKMKFIAENFYCSDADFAELQHIWWGVSICTQQEADKKIPILLQTPAAHRFVNLEPMLEDIDLLVKEGTDSDYLMGYHDDDVSGGGRVHLPYHTPYEYQEKKLDWVLLGCESGPGRRPMKSEWARSIVEQCKAAGVPIWVKQIDPKITKNYKEKIMNKKNKFKFWLNKEVYLIQNKDETKLIGFKISKNKKPYRIKREVLLRILGLPNGATITKIQLWVKKLIQELNTKN